MNTARKHRYSIRLLPFPLLLALALALAPNTSVAQQPKEPIPVVSSASVPLYPRIPLVAQITGVVRLRVSTDGNRVTTMEMESGQPILANAAEESIKTWQFEPHKPTTFETTFTYKLLPMTCDAKGNCNGRENDEVLLHFPTEVQISTRAAVLN
jgi:Gram-negative bacterial TonB protein C-terminal